MDKDEKNLFQSCKIGDLQRVKQKKQQIVFTLKKKSEKSTTFNAYKKATGRKGGH